MRLPNLNALRMFDAAARHLNFARAAEELHLTQGAVAQQVRRLEAELGHKLFHRQARGLALTDAGRSLHPKVRQAMELLHQATRQFAPTPERVTLSVPPSFAAKWLVPHLPEFEARHPDISLRVLAEETLADFSRDGIDIAVRIGPEPQGKGVQVSLMAPMALVAVAARDYSAPEDGPVDLERLSKAALIQDGHRHWERLLAEHGLAPTGRILQFNQTALAMDAAANGQGIALVPRLLLQGSFLLELWQAPVQQDQGFYVVWPGTSSRAIEATARWLLSSA